MMILLIILLFILSAGFFAGIETGILSANQINLYAKKEQGVLYAKAAYYLLIKPQRLLSVTLIGTNLSVVGATVFFKSYLSSLGAPEWTTWMGSLALSFVLLIFSEILPKSFFRRSADYLSIRLAPLLFVFFLLFYPLTLIFNSIVWFILTILRQHKEKKILHTRNDLRLLLKLVGRETGIPQIGQRLIDDVFDFKMTTAREVMVPFHHLPVCELNNSIEHLYSIYKKQEVPHIVIFSNRTDNAVGYVDIQDLALKHYSSIDQMLRPAVFYPDTKRIPDLLLEMNHRKLPLVFVSDEYGSILGIITANEIATKIVGSIPGRDDVESRLIEKLEAYHFRASGIVDIEDFTKETGISLEKGDFDTLGGFLCEKTGQIPQQGFKMIIDSVEYTVLDRDDRHIKTLEIRRSTDEKK
ncbi:MAG: HlyC/CorC family transporter [Spirochaetales bacterium]|nr:HlyC/CorC family transporter [Spirochaetales bacterium]